MGNMSVDPRTRLLMVVSLTTLAVIFNSVMSQGLLLLVTVILCLIFGKAGMRIFVRAKWLLGFFVIIAMLQSVFNHDDRVILSANNISILTVGGVELGICFLCRMLVIIFSAGIITTAGSRVMIQGLTALKIPYELAFMTTAALSFLPMIAADMRDSLTALQLRGIEMKKLALTRKVKVYGYLMIPVLEGIVIKARELSCAMEMRAFRAYDKRTSYVILSLKVMDYVIMILTMAGFALGLFMYMRLR